MNPWVQILLSSMQAAPLLVLGIESLIGSSKAGSDKKTLALQSLGLGTATAEIIDPKDKEVIDLVSNQVSSTIDTAVKVYNTTGWPSKQSAQPKANTAAKPPAK